MSDGASRGIAGIFKVFLYVVLYIIIVVFAVIMPMCIYCAVHDMVNGIPVANISENSFFASAVGFGEYIGGLIQDNIIGRAVILLLYSLKGQLPMAAHLLDYLSISAAVADFTAIPWASELLKLGISLLWLNICARYAADICGKVLYRLIPCKGPMAKRIMSPMGALFTSLTLVGMAISRDFAVWIAGYGNIATIISCVVFYALVIVIDVVMRRNSWIEAALLILNNAANMILTMACICLACICFAAFFILPSNVDGIRMFVLLISFIIMNFIAIAIPKGGRLTTTLKLFIVIAGVFIVLAGAGMFI